MLQGEWKFMGSNFTGPFETCPFSRKQLLERDYDPLGVLGARELVEERHKGYLEEYGRQALPHLAAVRGVLVSTGWIWGWGWLHDQLLTMHSEGLFKLRARFRNQYTWQPRVEFEPRVDVVWGLARLLEGTEISEIDYLDIAWPGGRATSVRQALSAF